MLSAAFLILYIHIVLYKPNAFISYYLIVATMAMRTAQVTFQSRKTEA